MALVQWSCERLLLRPLVRYSTMQRYTNIFKRRYLGKMRIPNILFYGLLICHPASSVLQAQTDEMHGGTFEVRDTAFLNIVDMVSGLETLADGHEWAEGPLWLDDQQVLIYNDVPRNTTYAWSESQGVKEYLRPSGYTGSEDFKGGEPGANGMDLDQDGNLILCQHGDRSIARMKSRTAKPKSKFRTLAADFRGKRFNSPNDLVVHSSGSIFFTDPPYGLPGQMDDSDKQLDYQGVYRLDPDGSVHLLSKAFTRPNGIALSPDETTLYVANSDPSEAYWKRFDITPDLSISNETLFYDATTDATKMTGLPDGLKVRSDGLIFASGPGGIYVFRPDGHLLGKVKTGQATSNCALDTDEDYLYITADMYLMRIALKK